MVRCFSGGCFLFVCFPTGNTYTNNFPTQTIICWFNIFYNMFYNTSLFLVTTNIVVFWRLTVLTLQNTLFLRAMYAVFTRLKRKNGSRSRKYMSMILHYTKRIQLCTHGGGDILVQPSTTAYNAIEQPPSSQSHNVSVAKLCATRLNIICKCQNISEFWTRPLGRRNTHACIVNLLCFSAPRGYNYKFYNATRCVVFGKH